jgi:hypothetical protein
MKAGVRVNDTNTNTTKSSDSNGLLKVTCVKMLLRLINRARSSFLNSPGLGPLSTPPF